VPSRSIKKPPARSGSAIRFRQEQKSRLKTEM
jgi:hypothetical protein